MRFLSVPSEPPKELCITEDGQAVWVIGRDYSRGWNGSQWIDLNVPGAVPPPPAGVPGAVPPPPAGVPGAVPPPPAGVPGAVPPPPAGVPTVGDPMW